LFLLIYIILSFILIPNFGTVYNIKNVLGQVCVLLTVACGQHYAVLNGGVDFSSTSVISLTCVIGASIMSQSDGLLDGHWFSIPAAIVVMLLIGLIFGIINGLSIITFKMPSFIVTMATQMIGAGLALLYTKGKTIGNLPDAFTKLGTGYIGIIPYALIFAAVIVFLTHTILSKTKLGRQIYAVGTNPKASLISGIPVKFTIFKLYVVSGVCAAVAGLIMLAQMESGAASFGSNMFIDIMASIIIGGTSPFGGRGKITHTVMGVFLVILINVSMNLLGVQWFVISIIKGAIILTAALIDLASKSKLRQA
jgi:ribose/xylose/arabinose/galactoside ABC-type transport system permease subunit